MFPSAALQLRSLGGMLGPPRFYSPLRLTPAMAYLGSQLDMQARGITDVNVHMHAAWIDTTNYFTSTNYELFSEHEAAVRLCHFLRVVGPPPVEIRCDMEGVVLRSYV
jgi:hypothetical protein